MLSVSRCGSDLSGHNPATRRPQFLTRFLTIPHPKLTCAPLRLWNTSHTFNSRQVDAGVLMDADAVPDDPQ